LFGGAKKKVGRANSLSAKPKKNKKKAKGPQMEFVPHTKAAKPVDAEPNSEVVPPPVQSIKMASSLLVPKTESCSSDASPQPGPPSLIQSTPSPNSVVEPISQVAVKPESIKLQNTDPIPTTKEELRAQNKQFVIRARALDVRLPTDNIEAHIKAGTILQATRRDDGSFDMDAALREMGWDGNDGTKVATQAEKEEEAAAEEKEKEEMGPNFALVRVLQEISAYYFKDKETHRGINFRKASESLKTHRFKVKSGKEAEKLKGIGKSTAKIIDEVVATGTCARLENFRDRGPLK
jgi:hypothetical protein